AELARSLVARALSLKEQRAAIAGNPRVRQPRFLGASRAAQGSPDHLRAGGCGGLRASRRVHGRQRTSQFHDEFVPPAVPPTSSHPTAVARDPHGGAKFGLVAVSLETVSKTVSGGFPLTRVRIPPPPFF